MRSKTFLWAVVVLAAGLPAMSGHGQEKTVRDLMARKLEQSQKVLHGIALNDLDKVAKSADELIHISKTAEWKVVKTPQYETFSNQFRQDAVSVAEAARNKNLDGAALAYVEMTLGCVKCHKYVREVRMTRLD